jgi:hypothetical protein
MCQGSNITIAAFLVVIVGNSQTYYRQQNAQALDGRKEKITP